MKRFGVSAVQALDHTRHLQYKNTIFEFEDNIAPISIGTVAAGDWLSTVPETLIAEGRFGVFPGESLANARHALSACLEMVAAADPWLQQYPPGLAWIEGRFEPGQTSLSEPILGALAEAHAAVLGSAPRMQGVPYV